MNWKRYEERQGPKENEVIIIFDARDAGQAYLQRRLEMYRKLGKTTILRPKEIG